MEVNLAAPCMQFEVLNYLRGFCCISDPEKNINVRLRFFSRSRIRLFWLPGLLKFCFLTASIKNQNAAILAKTIANGQIVPRGFGFVGGTGLDTTLFCLRFLLELLFTAFSSFRYFERPTGAGKFGSVREETPVSCWYWGCARLCSRVHGTRCTC